MEAKIAAILAGFARRLRFDAEALRAANRKQAMVPRGADRASTPPGPPPAWSCRPRTARSSSSCRVRRASCTRCGRPRSRPRRPARCSSAPSPFTSYTLRLFGIPESEIAQTLREIEAETDLSRARDHHLPAPRRARDRHPPPPGADGRATACRAGLPSATSGSSSASTATTIDEQVAALLRDGPHARPRRVVHGGPARRPAHRPARGLGLPAGGVVAYSNQAKSTCSASTRS